MLHVCHVDAPFQDPLLKLEAGYAARLGRISGQLKRQSRSVAREAETQSKKRASGKRWSRREVQKSAQAAARRVMATAKSTVAREASAHAERVERVSNLRWFNDTKGTPVAKAGLGYDPEPAKKRWAAKQRAEMDRQVRHWRDRTSRLVAEKIQAGGKPETVAKLVEERAAILGRKIENVAREQSQELLGELDRERAQFAGAKQYRWITRNDSRVRPEHERRHGKTYTYGKPPGSDGEPGDAYGCRCRAEPVISKAAEKRARKVAA